MVEYRAALSVVVGSAELTFEREQRFEVSIALALHLGGHFQCGIYCGPFRTPDLVV